MRLLVIRSQKSNNSQKFDDFNLEDVQTSIHQLRVAETIFYVFREAQALKFYYEGIGNFQTAIPNAFCAKSQVAKRWRY